MDPCRQHHLITACKKPRLIRYIAGNRRNCATLVYLDASVSEIHRAQAALEPKRKRPQWVGSVGNRQPVRVQHRRDKSASRRQGVCRSDEPGVAA